MNALTGNTPDPNDPLYFVRLGEQSLREQAQQRAVARHIVHDDDDDDGGEANDFENVDPRHDGWTPDRQRRFLTALARGFNVSRACDMVGMSRQSAYALRESARGSAFALGWSAALLRARDVLADELMDRAFNGVRETVTSDDGRTVTRRRHDNRLAMQMLARLDRRADAACTDTGASAARLAAADFEQLLELIGRDAAPARAGLFLAARIDRAGVEAAGEDDLAPIRTLARADRWLRTHSDVAQPLDTADLDPARRADWTAEQWARAEAAGLMQLAPTPQPEPEPEPQAASDAAGENAQKCQLRQPGLLAEADNPDDEPVWWDMMAERWKTSFPPPDDFLGEEEGRYGDPGYRRELDADEEFAMEAVDAARLKAMLPSALAERDAWFAAALAAGEAVAKEAGEQGAEPLAEGGGEGVADAPSG